MFFNLQLSCLGLNNQVFTLGSKIDQPLNTMVISRKVHSLSGGAISIVGGEYEINASGTWVSTAGTLNAEDFFRVRRLSHVTLYETSVTATVTIAGVPDTFTITTIVDPTHWWLDIDDNQILDIDGNPIEVI